MRVLRNEALTSRGDAGPVFRPDDPPSPTDLAAARRVLGPDVDLSQMTARELHAAVVAAEFPGLDTRGMAPEAVQGAFFAACAQHDPEAAMKRRTADAWKRPGQTVPCAPGEDPADALRRHTANRWKQPPAGPKAA
jgi:hypothetical protein